MLRMKYGEAPSLEFTEQVSREMAKVGWETGLELAKEKGPAPSMLETFKVTPEMLAQRPEMVADGYSIGDQVKGSVLIAKYSRYMQQFDSELTDQIAEHGARYSHHTSDDFLRTVESSKREARLDSRLNSILVHYLSLEK